MKEKLKDVFCEYIDENDLDGFFDMNCIVIIGGDDSDCLTAFDDCRECWIDAIERLSEKGFEF